MLGVAPRNSIFETLILHITLAQFILGALLALVLFMGFPRD